ncbi:MAG: hypothetical protein HY791_09250 [Deltaproteobacteria bacterium]|nr:hypothetical protein [Deltaproteobacteria bacterium]
MTTRSTNGIAEVTSTSIRVLRGSDPTIATFDHLTNYAGLEVGCGAPGPGVQISKDNLARDSYSVSNSIRVQPGLDLSALRESLSKKE